MYCQRCRAVRPKISTQQQVTATAVTAAATESSKNGFNVFVFGYKRGKCWASNNSDERLKKWGVGVGVGRCMVETKSQLIIMAHVSQGNILIQNEEKPYLHLWFVIVYTEL